jgi:hypothetical protein
MRYEELVVINDVNYYFIFTDEILTTGIGGSVGIFFAKNDTSNICDNWYMDTEQDVLSTLCQVVVNWVNINYPDSFYFLSTNYDVYGFYKSFDSEFSVGYDINERESKIGSMKIYISTYTKSIS